MLFILLLLLLLQVCAWEAWSAFFWREHETLGIG